MQITSGEIVPVTLSCLQLKVVKLFRKKFLEAYTDTIQDESCPLNEEREALNDWYNSQRLSDFCCGFCAAYDLTDEEATEVTQFCHNHNFWEE